MKQGARKPEIMRHVPREKYWLVDLLDDPDPNRGLANFCFQLKELEVLGKEIGENCADQCAEKDELDAYISFPVIAKQQTPKQYQRLQQLESEVTATLKRFTSHPTASFDPVTCRWACSDSWKEESPRLFMALQYLLRLVADNKLDFLRKCIQCNRWYIALRKRQQCCTARCRRKLMSLDPLFLTERAAYMKRHRRQEKVRQETQNRILQTATRKKLPKKAKRRHNFPQ